MPNFVDAPEVRRIAEELIIDYHPHLDEPELIHDAQGNVILQAPVVIVYLFRDDVPKSSGREVWGTAKKITGREWFWAKRHLLMHLRAERGWDQGERVLRLSTAAHDLEVFHDEEKRHPGWRHDLRTFESLCRRRLGQAAFRFEEGDSDAAAAAGGGS